MNHYARALLLTFSIFNNVQSFVVIRPSVTTKVVPSSLRKPHNMLPWDQLDNTLVSNLVDHTVSMSSLLISDNTLAPPETDGISYSKASYYTVLGLYLMSFPGLWSIIKRSTSAKVKRKTYVTPGEKASDPKSKSLRQQAGEIMACKCSISPPSLIFLCIML